MQPFDRYPHEGRQLLGVLGGANARREYGLKLHRLTGATACAYCGLSFVDDYHHWLLLAVDHVVPVSVARELQIPNQYYADAINTVLACSGCNGFGNRYRYMPPEPLAEQLSWTIEQFVALRDLIFGERSQRIAQRRADEQTFFSAYWRLSERRVP